MIYEKVSAHSSIAASILTFVLTVLGFSDLKLTAWWHYLLAFVALIGCYVVCLILVEVALLVVAKFTRPEPKINFQKDYADIEKYIHELYLKESQYDMATSVEYKTILSRELFLLSQKLRWTDLPVIATTRLLRILLKFQILAFSTCMQHTANKSQKGINPSHKVIPPKSICRTDQMGYCPTSYCDSLFVQVSSHTLLCGFFVAC